MATSWDGKITRPSDTRDVEGVRRAIAAGADVEDVDMYGNTALIWAASNGHTSVVQSLLEAGAFVNATNEDGWTALMYAAMEGRTAVIQPLLNAGAHVNACNHKGNTALMCAARNGHVAALMALIQGGANVNAVNKQGATALQWAATYGRAFVIQPLLDAGADINIVDNDGETALSIGIAKGHTKATYIMKGARYPQSGAPESPPNSTMELGTGAFSTSPRSRSPMNSYSPPQASWSPIDASSMATKTDLEQLRMQMHKMERELNDAKKAMRAATADRDAVRQELAPRPFAAPPVYPPVEPLPPAVLVESAPPAPPVVAPAPVVEEPPVPAPAPAPVPEAVTKAPEAEVPAPAEAVVVVEVTATATAPQAEPPVAIKPDAPPTVPAAALREMEELRARLHSMERELASAVAATKKAVEEREGLQQELKAAKLAAEEAAAARLHAPPSPPNAPATDSSVVAAVDESEELRAMMRLMEAELAAAQQAAKHTAAAKETMEKELHAAKVEAARTKAERMAMEMELEATKKATEKMETEREELKRELAVVSAQAPVPFCIIGSNDLEMGTTLGQGPFVIVSEATWKGRPVAVKSLKLEAGAIPKALEDEFTREALSQHAGLRSEFIVEVLGVCLEPTKCALVMELLPNGSLLHVLHNKRELPWSLRLSIARDIASGLKFLHANKVLHRDLNSLNVLLDDRMRAKLTDFGTSGLKMASVATSTAGAGAGAGITVRWNAPELFGRHARHSEASDIYSLGMVLWELCSRDVPFKDAKTSEALVIKIVDGQRDEIPAGTPPALVSLITRCWDGNVNARPASAAAVLKELIAIQDPAS